MSHIVSAGKKKPDPVITWGQVNKYASDSVLAQRQALAVMKQSIEAHPMTVFSVALGDFYIKTILGAMRPTSTQG